MKMKIWNRTVVLIILFSLLCMSISPIGVLSKQKNKTDSLILIEPGPMQDSILYADGSTVQVKTESVSHLMVGSKPNDMKKAEFKEMILSSREKFEDNDDKVYVGTSNPIDSGLDIVFVVSNPPAGAVAALDAVATYIESVFTDPIYVEINVQFAKMRPFILGGTTSNYALDTWTNTQTGLVNDMDGDDTIQNWLPTGSTIPVRYDGTSSTVTNENQCYITKANYNAAIGTVTGAAADMTFNNRFAWDWDPSDGVSSGTYCFQSVLAHETGHALGFTSAADFRTYEIETLDLYRFQKSDGTGDYNPDTEGEFQTTARLVDKDTPNDDHNSDIISVEYEMADGSPDQASHFRQGYVNAIMQPIFSSGATFYPDFYQTPDITMFDAIGWDYSTITNDPPTCTLAGLPISGDAPLPVVFSMTANDPDGTIDSWELDIDNDGTSEYSGTGNPPLTQAHTYNNPSYYTAELTVWDDGGAIGTATENIQVTAANLNPPNAPTNPDPTAGETDVDINPILSVYVSDPDGNYMDVSFYDASDDSLIGTDAGVASGDRASFNWPDRAYNTLYSWYAIADDGQYTTQSVAWSFTTEEEPQADYMYVYDISWDYTTKGRFKTLYFTVTVKWDSNENGIGEETDAVVENAEVTGTLSLGTTNWNFVGPTNSNGQVSFSLSRASSGIYTALVTDITHATYVYDNTLDVDNPDSYTLP